MLRLALRGVSHSHSVSYLPALFSGRSIELSGSRLCACRICQVSTSWEGDGASSEVVRAAGGEGNLEDKACVLVCLLDSYGCAKCDREKP